MKRNYSILAITTGLLMLASCSKNIEEPTKNEEKVPMTFGVSLEDGSELSTRAVVKDTENPKQSQEVIWQDGDYVTIFAKGQTSGDAFKFGGYFTDSEGTLLKNTGVFSGYSYKDKGTYYALYPAQSSAKLLGEAISFNIPNYQTAVKGTFDPNAGVQIGKADSWDNNSNATLSMKNACAYFAVTVGEGCTSVVVTAQSNAGKDPWYLAGDVEASIASGGVSISKFGTCQSSITLSGGTINDGGTFLIPFIPSTKCPKIFVKTTFYPESDRQNQPEAAFVPKTDEGTFQFVAGHIYSLGKFESSK